jgi:hypothetical protein
MPSFSLKLTGLEWCYSTDDYNSYLELKSLLNEISEKQVKQLSQITTGQQYYIEHIEN